MEERTAAKRVHPKRPRLWHVGTRKPCFAGAVHIPGGKCHGSPYNAMRLLWYAWQPLAKHN